VTESEFDLDRFVVAQAPVYAEVVRELRNGHKSSHWMWFIFPQIRGLGRSSLSRLYAIGSLDEAVAYLAHPLLGTRLRECTQLVLDVTGRSLADILGGIDATKFRSCMTLFSHAAPGEALFRSALDKYCDGKPDGETLRILRSPDPRRL
jgi:uncharacterized protein (DUF1810 family)